MEGFFKPSEIRSTRPGGDLIAKCGACGLYKQCQSPKMKPWGRGTLRVLLVGEAPGEQEDEEGKPFVGPSGEFLREQVNRAGVDFSELRVTNSIICHPPKNKMPKDGKEVEWCRPNLVQTIKEFKPRVIITLGKHSLESVLQPYWKDSLDGVERWAGRKIPLAQHWICPTWHPSYILRDNGRNRVLANMFRQHITAALEIDRDPPALPNFKDRVERLYDEREIVQAIRWFDQEGGLCAFDYEGNCLKPEYPKARLYSCAISNGKRTIAYPWFGDAIKATSIFLQSDRTQKIASNMKFEQRWTFRKLGHPVRGWDWDTMLAAHAMDNREAVCSLKFQAFVQLGVPTYNEHIEPYLESPKGHHYNRIHEIETGELLLYNGMDALLEWILARRQRREFSRISREPEGCYDGTMG